jgi:3-dehydroquinate dehydratase-2
MGREEPPGRPELTVVREGTEGEEPAGPERPEREDEQAPERVVLLLSGPNLNLLGQRQPEIYGRDSLSDHVQRAVMAAGQFGLALEHVQSDYEGALVEAVHGARGRAAAIVVNAGALSHYSWSLHDALAAFDGPVVELHITNPARREPWRKRSVVAPVATRVIDGYGVEG